MSDYWSGEYWQRRNPRLTRRGFLRASALGAVGLGAAALVGCGSDEEAAATPAATTAPSTAPGAGGAAAPSATAAAGAEAPRGGTLKVGMTAEPLYDPHFGFGGSDHQWLYPVFDSLVAYNKQGLLNPSMSLAEKWEQPEPTKTVLTLRPDAVIHDTGEPVNAELVMWNIARAQSEQALPRNDIAAISSVEAVDDRTIILNLGYVSAPLLTNLGDRGGFIVSRQAAEQYGDDFGRHPTGSGMFRVKEWQQDAMIALEASPSHWRKDAAGRQMPYMDGIEFKIFPENAVRVAALESGEIDVTAPTATETARLLASPGNLQSANFNGASLTSFSVNHSSPPFDNVNFRRGFASAMDRATWIKNFQTGRENECRGILHPANWAHSDRVEGWHLDLQKAADYLRASGIPEDQWVVKFHPGDKVDDTELFWESSLAQAGIKFQWAEAERQGPKLRVQTSQGGDGSSSFYLTGWSMRVDPDANVSAYYVQDGAYNAGGAPTPETEELIVKARQTLDIEERKEMYIEIQQKALDNVYSHFLMCYTISTIFAQPRVGNLEYYYGGEGKPRYSELWLSA